MGGGGSKPKKQQRGFCTEEWDETYQCFFYHYSNSGESSWKRPEGVAESEDAKMLKAQGEAAAKASAAARAAAKAAAEDGDETEGKGKRKVNNATGGVVSPELVDEAAQWTVGWDDNYEAEFYYNVITCENVWEKPACLVRVQSQAGDTVVSDEEVLKAARADPANWHVEWDSSYRCDFYVNKVTQESTWEVPACFESDDSDRVACKVAIPLPNPKRRRNSVMRRPSARPEKATLRRVSVLLTSPSTLPGLPGTAAAGGAGVAVGSNLTPISSVSSIATKPIKSKRRQSLAPRPMGLPPKPLFVSNQGISIDKLTTP